MTVDQALENARRVQYEAAVGRAEIKALVEEFHANSDVHSRFSPEPIHTR